MRYRKDGLPVGTQFGWWVSLAGRRLGYDMAEEKAEVGKVHSYEGSRPPEVCYRGMHQANFLQPDYSYYYRRVGTIYLTAIFGSVTSSSVYDGKASGRHRVYLWEVPGRYKRAIQSAIENFSLDQDLSRSSRLFTKLKKIGAPIHYVEGKGWEVDVEALEYDIVEVDE